MICHGPVRRSARWLPVGAVVVALAMGGCSGGGSGGEGAADAASPSSTTAPTTGRAASSPTTGPADPYAVPEVIDAAYVERVLAALYAVDGEALRSALDKGAVDAEVIGLLQAIYVEPQLRIEVEALIRALGDTSGFKRPPGDRVARVGRLRQVDRRCVIAEAVFDFESVVEQPSPAPGGETLIIALVPRGSAEGTPNPTGWSISDAEYIRTGEEPEQPCG